MSIPIITYLSIVKQSDGNVKIDDERLRFIRMQFEKLYSNNDIDDEQLREGTLKKLISMLKLEDNQTTVEYLNICVKERTDNDAKLEIISKFKDSNDFLESTTTMVSDEPKKTKKTKKPKEEKVEKVNNKSQDNEIQSLNEIICIIHRKLNKPEVNEFIQEFLFRQIQQDNQSSVTNTNSVPHYDTLHRLPNGSMIDLFIRQQMNERGSITFTRPRTKFRLVEPISLTDEFDTWLFDHFHNIFDIWLSLNLNNKQIFPTRWKLTQDVQINYIIVDRFTGTDDDRNSRHIERPSTKSLENFLRDICELEDNGMFEEWFEALTIDENITTYSHLTNLNQNEWERIQQLPMNALKMIKSYVDREKQMTDERKSKKIKIENQNNKTSYSKCELRANLHMIKLYFIRQLESEYDIDEIPKLDAYCVEQAFEEMRQEGYEDDGLFDDMKLFFQPLTVTDDELKINPLLLSKINRKQQRDKEKHENEIKKLNDDIEQINNDLIKLTEKIEDLKEKRRREYKRNQNEMEKKENLSYQMQIKLNREWSDKNDEWKKKIDEIIKQMKQKEKDLEDKENIKTNKTNLLKNIEENLNVDKTKIDKKMVKPHRGFIMYGPPGTGKSDIMSKLAKKIGIGMVGPPLAAGELERPLVGQSEAVILDLCMRANRLPYLMCCVSIDEIDSLAPKRDEDSSEGKVAKISVLLSVIEGIKDVPNLMFFSATNRLHMMDEAFLRRMSGKFFVGRPSSNARKRILNEIPKMILKPDIREQLATATTNFSGAALRALNRAVTVHYISERRHNANYDITDEDALILADRTARQYQLFLGLDTLPRLLLNNLDELRLFSKVKQKNNDDDESEGYHLPNDIRYTGKIIISLHDQCVRIETIKKFNKKYVVEYDLNETEQNLQQLLGRITSYGNDRNVQLLQLIDLNLLSSKGAYDEKKVFETLKERYDECMEYKRSMIIYDLDSLIGVNQSESESSMGTSTSSSIVNQGVYIYVTSRFREAKIEASRTDKKLINERWAIAVARDRFLLKKFTADVSFTLTREQEEEEDEEHKKSTDIIICVKCRDLYIESENKMGTCNYHDGFVYDNSSLDLQKYKPTDAMEQLNREESLVYKDSKQKDDIERRKTRLKYICCDTTVQPGGTISGCKKGKHGFGTKKQRRSTGQVLDKKMIDIWETACFESPEYNERWADLLTKRLAY